MKNSLRAGKKALSLFLAVLMLMSAFSSVFSVFADDVVEREATCTETGIAIDPDTGEPVATPPLGHNWGEWETVEEMTETKDGVNIRKCTRCDAMDTEYIQNTGGHHFVPTVYEPDCTQKGFTLMVCTCGSASCIKSYRTNWVPALGHDFDEGTFVEPTCTENGGIRFTCKRVFGEGANQAACGYSELREPIQPATGHSMGEWVIVDHPTVPDVKAHKRECMNPGCTYWEYETSAEASAADDGVNIYYTVNFYNEWVADKYQTYNGGKTKLAMFGSELRGIEYNESEAYRTDCVYENLYVLKGTDAVYPLAVNPKREKDFAYGLYRFLGWGKSKAELSEPCDLTNVQANMNVYALFEPEEVYYNVVYKNDDGTQLTQYVPVMHGKEARHPATNPNKNSDMHFKYEFKEWNYDYTHVYENVDIIAVYTPILKEYRLVYHSWNRDVIIPVENLNYEVVTYGGRAMYAPDVEPQQEDPTYVYQFNNEWVDGNGNPVDLNNIVIPNYLNEGDEFHIYAKQRLLLKDYRVSFQFFNPYDNTPAALTDVQIFNSKGRLVKSGTTDSDGFFEFIIGFDEFYKVTASKGSYGFEGTFFIDSSPRLIDSQNRRCVFNKKIDAERTYSGNIFLNDYTDYTPKPCKCICHSMFGGLWITIMNLLYRVFGTRHICCNDMLYVHKDKLLYA